MLHFLPLLQERPGGGSPIESPPLPHGRGVSPGNFGAFGGKAKTLGAAMFGLFSEQLRRFSHRRQRQVLLRRRRRPATNTSSSRRRSRHLKSGFCSCCSPQQAALLFLPLEHGHDVLPPYVVFGRRRAPFESCRRPKISASSSHSGRRLERVQALSPTMCGVVSLFGLPAGPG